MNNDFNEINAEICVMKDNIESLTYRIIDSMEQNRKNLLKNELKVLESIQNGAPKFPATIKSAENQEKLANSCEVIRKNDEKSCHF